MGFILVILSSIRVRYILLIVSVDSYFILSSILWKGRFGIKAEAAFSHVAAVAFYRYEAVK